MQNNIKKGRNSVFEGKGIINNLRSNNTQDKI